MTAHQCAVRIEISGTTGRREVEVEFRHRDLGGTLSRRNVAQQRVPAGKAVRMAPDWDRLSRAKVDQIQL